MSQSSHPLAYRDFRIFWVTRFCAVLAQNAMVIVIGWQAYVSARTTYHMDVKSASFQLGLIGLAQFLPLMLLTPVAGWVADHVNRRLVACTALGLDLINALILGSLSARGVVTLPMLFTIAALHGVVRAFIGPSLSALAANIVPKAILPRAIAINSIAWQTGSIAGPTISGFLYMASAPLPYWVSAVMLGIAIIGLLLMHPITQAAQTSTAHPLRQMSEGFTYVRRHRVLLGCISLDLFAVLFGGATALIPAYARDILHVGSSGFGLMRAAPGAGAALTAFILSARPISHDVGNKMLIAVGIYGLVTVIFGLSHMLWLSLAMLFLLGVADMVSVYIRGSLVQLHTPDQMRGRVSAISGLFISASNELGEAESGLLAAVTGPMIAVVGGGIAAIGLTLLWSRVFPELPAAKTFAAPHLDVEPVPQT